MRTKENWLGTKAFYYAKNEGKAKGHYCITVTISDENDEGATFKIEARYWQNVFTDELKFNLNDDWKQFTKQLNEYCRVIYDEYFTEAAIEKHRNECSKKATDKRKKETEKGYYGYRPWEIEEDNFIKKNADKMSVTDLAKALRRSYSSVSMRKHQLSNNLL